MPEFYEEPFSLFSFSAEFEIAHEGDNVAGPLSMFPQRVAKKDIQGNVLKEHAEKTGRALIG